MQQDSLKETNCPQCPRHCPAQAPACPRGRAYFGLEPEKRGGAAHRPPVDMESLTPDGKTIMLLRQCGHQLHHSFGPDADTAQLLSCLTSQEKETLTLLLQKCLQHWEKQS